MSVRRDSSAINFGRVAMCQYEGTAQLLTLVELQCVRDSSAITFGRVAICQYKGTAQLLTLAVAMCHCEGTGHFFYFGRVAMCQGQLSYYLWQSCNLSVQRDSSTINFGSCNVSLRRDRSFFNFGRVAMCQYEGTAQLLTLAESQCVSKKGLFSY